MVTAQRSAKYLGTQVVADGRHGLEIGKRIRKATAAHKRLSQKVWKNASWGVNMALKV